MENPKPSVEVFEVPVGSTLVDTIKVGNGPRLYAFKTHGGTRFLPVSTFLRVLEIRECVGHIEVLAHGGSFHLLMGLNEFLNYYNVCCELEKTLEK